MLKCIQIGDKKDLHKDFLQCFEVLKTFSEDKGKIHFKKPFMTQL